MLESDLISVIVTCFNQEKFLSDTLTSINSQTWKNWECIIVDDGSNDNSATIAKNWVEKDSRFKYFYQENRGVSATRNIGIENAKGKFIQFVDGDDFLKEEKLALSIKEFQKDKNLDIVFTDFLLFDQRTKKIQPAYCELKPQLFNFENVLYKWDDGFSIPIHTAVLKKELLNGFSFPENIRAKEDWLLWVMVFQKRPQILFLKKPQAIYRRHNKSITMSSTMFEEHMQSLKYLQRELSPEEYEKLLETFMKRYYLRSLHFKKELLRIKKSKLYSIYHLLKKIEKKFN